MAAAVSAPNKPDIIAQILDPSYPAPEYNFAFSEFLKREYRFGIPPNRPLCKPFQEGHCPLGNACPDKHVSTRLKDVCKHWLKGLCKRGDQCEFLHEYNIRRMPECTHYARTLSCPNGDDCLYQHIDPISKLPPCPHYERGFCPLGPQCGRSHVRRKLCPFYLAGFCPQGRQCKEGSHPKWKDDEDLPRPVPRTELTAQQLESERARMREEGEREEREEGSGGGGGTGGWRRERGGDREGREKRGWRGRRRGRF